MKKNVAGQVIGCQMVSASDGSAFTGSVTVYVTGDAGTQAAGSVGSGACTHEGNGFHTYAPAQAETNYDHVAFTFTGSGAVPATVQVYTTFPQTGDNYSRLGSPAGASVSADIAAVKSDSAAILLDTDDLQTNQGDWATATGFSTHSAADVWSVATRVLTANTNLNDPTAAAIADAVLDETLSGHTTAGTLGKAVADIEADTNELQSDDIPATLATLATASALAIVDTVVDNLNLGIIYGSAATGTLSTTQATTDLTGYADDQLIGRVIIWTSGNCEGEATDITDYANSSGLITFTALTTAPGNGDTFKIV